MAASAFIHSKLAKVWLETAGGVSTEISDSIDSMEFNEELEILDVTTFGSTSKRKMIGFADGKGSASGFFNRTFRTHLKGLKEAFRDGTIDSATLIYAPEGNSTGDVRVTAEIVVTSVNFSAAVKDPVKSSFEFETTGPVVEDTF